MGKVAKLLLVLLMFGCTKYEDYHCYVVDYIEVAGELVKMDEFRCGCFPSSSPDTPDTYEYNGKEYETIRELDCK